MGARGRGLHRREETSVSLDLRIRRHAGISGIPGNDLSGGEAFLHVNGALVGRAFEEEGDVLLVEHEFTVDKDIDALQELHRFRHDFGKVAEKITVEEVAGEAPDGFLRVALLEARDEGEKAFLIRGFHGFAAQKGEAFVVFLSDFFQDMVFNVFREGLAVGEVPRFRVEAALAVVRASGDKERVADAGTICDIVFFNVGVIHDSEIFLMDKMGSGLRASPRGDSVH